MKLYLLGGAEITLNQTEELKTLIKKAIVDCRPQTVLHIPFARLNPTEKEWQEGWFKKLMEDTKLIIYDAREKLNTVDAKDLVVFINGGPDRRKLITTIRKDKNLFDLILKAKAIVAESSGSMCVGEFMRADRDGDEMIKGLGILKNTVIEPHYVERNCQEVLWDDMKKSGSKYGLGIDCVTALVTDFQEYPKNWSKIGKGNIVLKINNLV